MHGDGKLNDKNAPVLEVTDVHKSFGELEVLKGVSLSAREGDVISIIGSSGSGKSTFLRCINLLELPSQGEIILRGEPVSFKQSTFWTFLEWFVAHYHPSSVMRDSAQETLKSKGVSYAGDWSRG